MLARKQSLVVVVVAVLLLSVVAAHAGEKRFPRANHRGSPGEFRGSRSYVALGAGYALDMAREDVWNSQLAALGHSGTGRFEVEGSPVVDGRIGRRFAAHLAAELQVEYAVGFDTRLKANAGSVDAASDWALSMTVNTKVPVLTGRVQPFAIVGAGGMFARIEDRLGADLAANDFGAGASTSSSTSTWP